MNWEERFKELARKKKEELNRYEEYKRQCAEERKRRVQRVGPVIKEVARALGATTMDSHDSIRDEWRIYPFGHGDYVIIRLYTNIYVEVEDYPCSSGHRYFEEIRMDDIENKTLDDRLRNAIAKAVEFVQPI